MKRVHRARGRLEDSLTELRWFVEVADGLSANDPPAWVCQVLRLQRRIDREFEGLCAALRAELPAYTSCTDAKNAESEDRQ